MAEEEEVDMKGVGMTDEAELQQFKDLQGEINLLVMRNQSAQAFKLAIGKLPPQGKNPEVKKLAAEALLPLFANLDKNAAENILNDFSTEERATVMKYVFKCMEVADKKTCEALLVWHGKLVEKEGNGIIMQAFIDKRV